MRFNEQAIKEAGRASTKDQVKVLNSVGYFDKFNQLPEKVRKPLYIEKK